MPGTILGGTPGTSYPTRRADRWLNFRFAFPPNQNIRDREDAPGARCPYNLWAPSDLVGGEDTGMSVLKIQCFDDDISFKGTKSFSYSIEGQVLNSVGAPAAGVKVELWLISVDWPDAHQPLLIGETTANSNGMYGFRVPDTVKKYKVEAYDGSKGGVTVRNLVGA